MGSVETTSDRLSSPLYDYIKIERIIDLDTGFSFQLLTSQSKYHIRGAKPRIVFVDCD